MRVGERGRADQDWGSHEEVINGVVQQVDAGGGVEIRVTHQLAGEQRLSGAAAQQAAHLAVRRVHSVGQHLQTHTQQTTAAVTPGLSVELTQRHTNTSLVYLIGQVRSSPLSALHLNS